MNEENTVAQEESQWSKQPVENKSTRGIKLLYQRNKATIILVSLI